jgi:hypothetical protein
MHHVHAPHLGRDVVIGGCKLPPPQQPGEVRFHLKDYLRPKLNPPPSSVDYTPNALTALRRIYKNDTLGCCVVASKAHMQGVWTGNASGGAPFLWSDDQIVAMYSACCGYVVGDSSTDVGCDPIQVANYVTSGGGFPDGSKAAGWIQIDPTNQAEVEQGLYLFEDADICVGLPDAWISPFPSGDGFVWDVTSAGQDTNNGHCFPGAGYDESGVTICTWALLGKITWAALAAYANPLLIILSEEQLAKGQAKAPNGVDWDSLREDLASLPALGSSVMTPPAP